MNLFKRRVSTPKNILLGMAGGLAGAWLMNQSQGLMGKIAGAASHDSAEQPPQQAEPATVQTAERLVEPIMGRPLPDSMKKIAEPLVHYGFGALVGALYGGLMAKAPLITLGGGTLYGAAVWLLADEIAVPALGLSGPPKQYPVSKHLQALGSHLIYGLAAEGVRRAGVKLTS